MKRKYLILLCTIFLTFAHAEENKVDCLILEDENSIICKYSHQRISTEKKVIVKWVEPNGTETRRRVMIIPAFHGSVYDYRYIEGRTKGKWHFSVTDGEDEYTTSFMIE